MPLCKMVPENPWWSGVGEELSFQGVEQNDDPSKHQCHSVTVSATVTCCLAVFWRVIFNVVNFSKTKSLYRDGMAPMVKSTSRPKCSAKVVIPGGSISLLLTTAFVEIVERLYSAETMYESDPKMNVFIV
ncbi:hypothetical protein TURU_076836 [Turdus rufiventris]|nr:hypothetical protein TURU_076836 [Turdus rufiventris]